MIAVSVSTLGVVCASIPQPDGTVHRISLSPGSSLANVPDEVRTAAELAWTPEVIAAFVASQLPDTEPEVPPTVSARQIRLWLVGHGISLTAVDAAIEAIPDALQRDLVRVEWEYAPWIDRTHPMLVPLAGALGITAEGVDQAFAEAALL